MAGVTKACTGAAAYWGAGIWAPLRIWPCTACISCRAADSTAAAELTDRELVCAATDGGEGCICGAPKDVFHWLLQSTVSIRHETGKLSQKKEKIAYSKMRDGFQDGASDRGNVWETLDA